MLLHFTSLKVRGSAGDFKFKSLDIFRQGHEPYYGPTHFTNERGGCGVIERDAKEKKSLQSILYANLDWIELHCLLFTHTYVLRKVVQDRAWARKLNNLIHSRPKSDSSSYILVNGVPKPPDCLNLHYSVLSFASTTVNEVNMFNHTKLNVNKPSVYDKLGLYFILITIILQFCV